MMKVFISWSGERSRRYGEVLRGWLPGVLQLVQPYFTPEDVAKGSRWAGEIARELDASSFGVLIMTPENRAAPWLLFEAGALGKNLGSGRVCPVLFGLEPTDLEGPLVQFQAARFNRDEIKRLMRDINAEFGDSALSASTLESVFDMWWPRLESEMGRVTGSVGREGEGLRSDRAVLQEILGSVRELVRDGRTGERYPVVLDELDGSLAYMLRVLKDPAEVPFEERLSAVEDLAMALPALLKRGMMKRTWAELDGWRGLSPRLVRRVRPAVGTGTPVSGT